MNAAVIATRYAFNGAPTLCIKAGSQLPDQSASPLSSESMKASDDAGELKQQIRQEQ